MDIAACLSIYLLIDRCTKKDSFVNTDILIVGGGLSGLALADHLTRAGRDHLLIEAQERLGGRILSPEVMGARFDLGPAWFWPDQPRIAALAQRFDIPVFEQYAEGDLMLEGPTGAVQRRSGFAPMQGSYRLHGGMGGVIDALAGCLGPEHILTGTRLETLHRGSDGITARLDQSGTPLTVRANQIVLAVPPRALADTVSFDPPLDAAQLGALGDIPTWMAGQAKILAVYDRPHWRSAGLSGDAMSQRGPMIEIHDASPMEGGPYALFGFVGVPADLREAHRHEIEQSAIAQLVALFGPELAEPRAVFFQDWAGVPTIARPQDRAAMTHHPRYGLPGSLKGLAATGVHFASTETARGYGGFLEGALEAAETTATRLTRG